MSGDNRYDSQEGSVSLEGRFVEHYFRALDSLQTCWNGDTGFNKEKFNLQLLYLIRLLPDKKKQKDILRQWDEAQDAAKEIAGLTTNERQSYAGMEVVTELVLFVCDAFELINSDITGPATSKQYRDAAVQIPDMTVTPPEIT
jgi:hypothetical protein